MLNLTTPSTKQYTLHAAKSFRTKRSMDRRQEDGGVKRQRIEEVAAPAAASSSDEVENLKRQLAAAKAALAKSKPTEKVFQISKKRRVTVTKKNAVLIDIREWYEKDGEMRPGRKGICLPANQFEKFCELIPAIAETIHDMKKDD